MDVKKVAAGDQKPLRIGMLGGGFMGKCHASAFRQIPHFYPGLGLEPRLLVLCGRDPERTKRQAAQLGFAEWTADWRELVADERIDLLDNCAPDPLHAEPCIAALERGKHVICEKPLALTVEEARRMRDAARASSGKAMCVFNYRFLPAVRLARDLIEAGEIGRVYHLRVSYLQMAGCDPALPPERVWYSAWPHSGVLQGIGCHAIDQCRYLAGEISSVAASVRSFHPERALPSAGNQAALADEASAAVLEFESGALGMLESSGVAAGRKNFLAWEVNGSKGSLRWDLEHPNSLFAWIGGESGARLAGFREISATGPEHPYAGAWWPPGHNLGWEHGHVIEKWQFLEALAGGKQLGPHLAAFEDGYRAAAVIDAMRRSNATGRKVAVEY